MGVLSSFFGSKEESPQLIDSAIDLVTYAASLVSNQDDIGMTLDQIREITVKLDPTTRPSSQDETALIKYYLQLEAYLTTKERLRQFNKDELRKRIAPTLVTRIVEVESVKMATSKT